MHYTDGGKHVGTAEHTLVLENVTCGTCIRTRNFRAAMDSRSAMTDTARAIELAADAGFFTGFTGHNHVISANYGVTCIDRFGINVTYGNGQRVSFLSLPEFLAWLTPVGMLRVIESVIDDGMTWTAAMDLEREMQAEVAAGARIERALNLITEERVTAMRIGVAEDVMSAPAPFRTRGKVKNSRQARRYRKGA